MKLLLDCHGDDGVLFASFTIMKERPLVLVVFDSYIQTARGAEGCEASVRRWETINALYELDDYQPPQFLGFHDDMPYRDSCITDAIRKDDGGYWQSSKSDFQTVTEIWAPAYEEGGHEQHNLVARACDAFEGICKVHRYLTYTRSQGKSRGPSTCPECAGLGYAAREYDPCDRCGGSGDLTIQVLPRSGEDIARKHRALACFKSQMQLDPRIGCLDWFMGDLREYALIDSVERVGHGSE
jgi:hypothetical protein